MLKRDLIDDLMTELRESPDRFVVLARRHARHVWLVIDTSRATVDVVAFRPEGIGPTRDPFAIARMTAEVLIDLGLGALDRVERRLAGRVGLRLP